MACGDLFTFVTRLNGKQYDPFETVKPVITLSQIRTIAMQTT